MICMLIEWGLVNRIGVARLAGMSEFHDMPGHLFRRMHQISVAVFADNMARAGIDLTPVQFAALSAIMDHPGMDQATLASAVAYDRATLGGVVDRLENKGYVARKVCETDRRARELTLTDAGEALLRAARPVARDLQAQIVARLDAREQAVLISLLRKATTGKTAPAE